MIRNFRHRGLKRFYERGDPAQIHATYRKKVARILADLDVARMPADMDFPGLRLHPLSGDLKGFWSVTVSANWRIIFRFDNNEVMDVDFIDYH
ncbi:MAG TPA: type II toxin-antitoxin system RelE/ParE family toxin [Stellaceae bacterium]|jgi:proteic killer suppression protein|nr:type II toxin-antitoxin system RelE/ParE family toxin [Stellaceae bacterium]